MSRSIFGSRIEIAELNPRRIIDFMGRGGKQSFPSRRAFEYHPTEECLKESGVKERLALANTKDI